VKNALRVVLAGILLSTGLLLCCRRERGPANPTVAESKVSGHLEASKFPGTLMGLQYETYFTNLNVGWDAHRRTDIPGLNKGTQEAIPVLGTYSSYDVNIIRKHEEWFEHLGIDWLLIDWSNFLWMSPAWEQHQGATREIEETTELLFKTYSQMEKEGRHPPKLVIMLGLQNGPPVPHALERLNGIVAWTKKAFLDNPEYQNQWLYYNGKPLLTILFNPLHPCEDLKTATAQSPLEAPDWTIRWMASQLQVDHAAECGMWSWMDGIIRQVVTYNSGAAEETVVTPSAFPIPDGWLDPRTVGRDHGAPYLKSWEVAFETHPKFIQIHQWNEFAGQPKGMGAGPKHNIFGDEYDAELSDDIEPTQLHACGYRGCGGWGYYYVNLTKALISLYRNQTPDITVMALSAPFQTATVQEGKLPLSWKTMGKNPSSYTLEIDEKIVANNITGQSHLLDLSQLHPGKHRVNLVANGAHTYFNLGAENLAEKSDIPLPVTSTIEFTYAPGSR
jgi:hypothetical protein